MSRLRRLFGLVGEDVEGPGRHGASLANCRVCVLLDQQRTHGARAEDFDGNSSILFVVLVFSECLLSPFSGKKLTFASTQNHKMHKTNAPRLFFKPGYLDKYTEIGTTKTFKTS